MAQTTDNNNEVRTKRGGYGYFTDAEWDAFCRKQAEYYATSRFTGD